MAGPYLDPKAAQQMQNGATAPGYSPLSIANQLGLLMGGKQAAPQDPQQAAQQGAAQPQVGGTQTKSHILLMQQAAEDAKQKYMKDNNVDENGDPVAGN